MEAYNFIFAFIPFTVLCGVQSLGDLQLLNWRLDALSNRFDAFQNLVSSERDILLTTQEERIFSLRTELKTIIRQQVQTALSEILRAASFQDIIKSEVVSEMKHLQRSNHQMRRQLHQLMTSLGQVRKDNIVYRKALLKGERENNELRSDLLTVQLSEFESQNSELRVDNTSYEESNSVVECSKCLHSEVVTNRLIEHDRQISELNETLMADLCKLSKNTINGKETSLESTTRLYHTTPSTTKAESTTKSSPTTTSTTAAESTTKSSPTTPSTTAPESTTKSPIKTPSTTVVHSTTLTTRLTTSDPQEERSQILVAPLWSSSSHRFRKVNINNHSLEIYRHLSLREVDSVIYVSKLDSILIGLDNPAKIISSKLYSSRVVTVRHNVGTYGMAADDKRGIIFLTTYHPTRTISRMSLQGKNFTAVVILTHYGSNPRTIVVHPETKMIYSCNYAKVFSVRYDGRGLTTLDTGRQIRAVTLDISNDLLYYGYDEKLMKMSLSTNTSSEVTEFGFSIWNLVFYRDTVYYISYSEPYGTVGAVDVRQNIVSYTLQRVKVPYIDYFAICLIP